MQVGKGQGQHHHHQTTERVEHLAPELDFVALGGLAVGFEVADVLEQVDGGHAFGPENGGGHHVGGDLGRPEQCGLLQVLHVGFVGTAVVKAAALHLLQRPGVTGAKVGALRLGLFCQPTGTVEFKNTHVLHGAVGPDGTYVDGVSVLALALF